MNNNQKQIAPLETITASTLMNTQFDPLHFSIEKLLPQGIFILAGSGKIGKSWLALDMCVAVSTGGKLWDYNASHGDVLYLALEDTHPRLQSRLQLIQEKNINTEQLHLAISSLGISDGLITQMKEFLCSNPNTKLIVIDTLERIRNTDQDKSMYACDYRDMTALREITNAHAVTLLLVHHTRKMYDPDPLNTLSGSTGLVGAVDGVWVLEKEKRIGDKGKLTIANRDTEGYCFSVLFDKDNCRWHCLGSAEDVADEEQNSFCLAISEFVKTVVDRNHIHNHFVWCAVNLNTHNRYHSNKRSYHEIQDLSDSLCRENGLSVIEVKSGKRGKSRFEYDMAKQGSSYKEKLRIAIDNATLKANSFEEFLQLLASQGYEIKQGKYLSFKHKDGERFTRAKTIGEDYTEERIRERIKTKAPVRQSQPQQPPSIRKLLDLSQDKFQNSKGLTHWGKIQNLKIMADTMNLLREKGLTNLSEFDSKFTTANTAFDKVSTALKSTENRLKDLTELQKQLRIYGRTKDMYSKFQQSRNKDKFIRETDGAESDVMLHEAAKRYLSAYKKEHGTVPKSAELKPLLATLQKEKSALYEQYKTAKAEQGELMKLHMNLQKILGKEQKQQEVDR